MENTDWSALGFDYRKTDYNVRYSFADGKWSDMVVTDDEYIQMHMSASCLHYGIELFEGLKAFRGVDGKVRLFRVADNARRKLIERIHRPVDSGAAAGIDAGLLHALENTGFYYSDVGEKHHNSKNHRHGN